jgi:glycosyltransferase involved in cell wall biosynthesis
MPMRARARLGTGRRVLLIVENCPLPPDVRVLREAKVLRDAGYAVSVISPKGLGFNRRREEVEGIKVLRHPVIEGRTPLGFLLEFANALAWEMALTTRIACRRGIDVIHVANPPDLLLLVGAVFKPFGVQLVFDQHDLGPELFEVKFGRHGLAWKALLALERLSFRLADVAIATNESYRRIAIGRGGMAPDDVFVVRNGPDLTETQTAPGDVPDLRRGRRHLVVYAGVMGSQDGVDHLLDAARILVLDEHRDVQFVLAGPGSELERLRSRADALGIGDRLTFTGLVPHREVLAIIEAADVCVSPDGCNALNDRSTMVKVMEYMAAGRPVVQFDLHEGRESAGEAALYATDDAPAALAAQIARLLDDPELRDRLGRVGRERVASRLAWQHQIPALLAAYDRLDAKRADRSRRRHRVLAREGAP